VDATINDKLTFLDYQQTEGDTGLEIAAETTDEARNAFAFRKGSDSLVAAVDTALADLRADGTLAEISEKYFGADVSG
jgi:cystine transport system substrate-binding protein